VISQPNQKLPAALNTGHRAAKGAALTWVSDDCWVERTWLEHLCRGLQALGRDCGMVFTDYFSHRPDGSSGKHIRTTANTLKTVNCIGCSFLYRREVYETIGDYDPELMGVEDWDYWRRAAACFRLAHLPVAPGYHYVLGLPTSMTIQLAERIRDLRRKISDRYASTALFFEGGRRCSPSP